MQSSKIIILAEYEIEKIVQNGLNFSEEDIDIFEKYLKKILDNLTEYSEKNKK